VTIQVRTLVDVSSDGPSKMHTDCHQLVHGVPLCRVARYGWHLLDLGCEAARALSFTPPADESHTGSRRRDCRPSIRTQLPHSLGPWRGRSMTIAAFVPFKECATSTGQASPSSALRASSPKTALLDEGCTSSHNGRHSL